MLTYYGSNSLFINLHCFFFWKAVIRKQILNSNLSLTHGFDVWVFCLLVSSSTRNGNVIMSESYIVMDSRALFVKQALEIIKTHAKYSFVIDKIILTLTVLWIGVRDSWYREPLIRNLYEIMSSSLSHLHTNRFQTNRSCIILSSPLCYVDS